MLIRGRLLFEGGTYSDYDLMVAFIWGLELTGWYAVFYFIYDATHKLADSWDWSDRFFIFFQMQKEIWKVSTQPHQHFGKHGNSKQVLFLVVYCNTLSFFWIFSPLFGIDRIKYTSVHLVRLWLGSSLYKDSIAIFNNYLHYSM